MSQSKISRIETGRLLPSVVDVDRMLQVLVHHVVFALPPGEVHPWDLLLFGEAVHRRGETVSDPGQRGGRGDLQAQLALHIPQQPAGVLQLRDIDVEVHPVDALHLERHMLGQHLSDSAR